MKIQEYIDLNKCERNFAKRIILMLIDTFRLEVPCDIQNSEEFCVTFEGLTIPRWHPWNRIGEYKTALSKDRLYMIKQFAEVAPAGGKFIECGVFSGGVTRMLLDMGKPVIAFDTFHGIKNSTPDVDLHEDGQYDGGDVSKYIFGAEIVKGIIPETFSGRDDKISFAHIDLDVYLPTKFSLEYVFPRLLDGGAIILDDYGSWTTPGVRKAVDEFHEGKKIYLPTGQMVIIK